MAAKVHRCAVQCGLMESSTGCSNGKRCANLGTVPLVQENGEPFRAENVHHQGELRKLPLAVIPSAGPIMVCTDHQDLVRSTREWEQTKWDVGKGVAAAAGAAGLAYGAYRMLRSDTPEDPIKAQMRKIKEEIKQAREQAKVNVLGSIVDKMKDGTIPAKVCTKESADTGSCWTPCEHQLLVQEGLLEEEPSIVQRKLTEVAAQQRKKSQQEYLQALETWSKLSQDKKQACYAPCDEGLAVGSRVLTQEPPGEVPQELTVVHLDSDKVVLQNDRRSLEVSYSEFYAGFRLVGQPGVTCTCDDLAEQYRRVLIQHHPDWAWTGRGAPGWMQWARDKGTDTWSGIRQSAGLGPEQRANRQECRALLRVSDAASSREIDDAYRKTDSRLTTSFSQQTPEQCRNLLLGYSGRASVGLSEITQQTRDAIAAVYGQLSPHVSNKLAGLREVLQLGPPQNDTPETVAAASTQLVERVGRDAAQLGLVVRGSTPYPSADTIETALQRSTQTPAQQAAASRLQTTGMQLRAAKVDKTGDVGGFFAGLWNKLKAGVNSVWSKMLSNPMVTAMTAILPPGTDTSTQEGLADGMRRAQSKLAEAEDVLLQNCYRDWNLNPEADVEQIKSTYRQLTLKRHPDKPGGSQSAFLELNECKDMLDAAAHVRARASRVGGGGESDVPHEPPMTPAEARSYKERVDAFLKEHSLPDLDTAYGRLQQLWTDVTGAVWSAANTLGRTIRAKATEAQTYMEEQTAEFQQQARIRRLTTEPLQLVKEMLAANPGDLPAAYVEKDQMLAAELGWNFSSYWEPGRKEGHLIGHALSVLRLVRDMDDECKNLSFIRKSTRCFPTESLDQNIDFKAFLNRISGEVPPNELKEGEPVYYDSGATRTYATLVDQPRPGSKHVAVQIMQGQGTGGELTVRLADLKPGAPPDQEKENRQSRLPSYKACNAARQLWGELLKDYSKIRRIDHAVVQGWAARLEQLTTDLDEILHQIETGKQEGLKSWDD